MVIQFYYANDNGLARLFPDDFADEVPEHAIALVMTCVCISHLIKYHQLICHRSSTASRNGSLDHRRKSASRVNFTALPTTPSWISSRRSNLMSIMASSSPPSVVNGPKRECKLYFHSFVVFRLTALQGNHKGRELCPPQSWTPCAT